MLPLPELPVEVWTRVFRLMDPRTLVNAAQVCRAWRGAIDSDGGTIYRDVLLRDKTLPNKERLAFPKKVVKKVEREHAERTDCDDNTRLVKYRDLVRICVMRTCPRCMRARDMCVDCGKAYCEQCALAEKLLGHNVFRLNRLFKLPQYTCSWCKHGEFVSKNELVQRKRMKKMVDEWWMDLDDCYDEAFWECYDPKSD